MQRYSPWRPFDRNSSRCYHRPNHRNQHQSSRPSSQQSRGRRRKEKMESTNGSVCSFISSLASSALHNKFSVCVRFAVTTGKEFHLKYMIMWLALPCGTPPLPICRGRGKRRHHSARKKKYRWTSSQKSTRTNYIFRNKLLQLILFNPF